MAASFELSGQSSGTATLTVEGMDSEDRAKTPMLIALNGVVLYQGASPFPNDDLPFETGNWSALRLQFDASILQPGVNTLTISNLASGQRGLPPFVAVDYAIVGRP
jgi:hypothetical protein